MKYQIYLDKQTSEIINGISEKENRKPASLIKEFLEGFFKVAQAVKEVKDHDKRQQEKR